jgi:hypothetical protein
MAGRRAGAFYRSQSKAAVTSPGALDSDPHAVLATGLDEARAPRFDRPDARNYLPKQA